MSDKTLRPVFGRKNHVRINIFIGRKILYYGYYTDTNENGRCNLTKKAIIFAQTGLVSGYGAAGRNDERLTGG